MNNAAASIAAPLHDQRPDRRFAPLVAVGTGAVSVPELDSVEPAVLELDSELLDKVAVASVLAELRRELADEVTLDTSDEAEDAALEM